MPTRHRDRPPRQAEPPGDTLDELVRASIDRARGVEVRPPPANQNMGRIQQAPPRWRDWGVEGKGDTPSIRGNEMADKKEREEYEKPLVAAYRHIIGPTPILQANDTAGARAFLYRIEAAIDEGGWTRSEWRRLYRLRDRFKARADGRDPRFQVVGNKGGGLDRATQAQVSDAKLIEMMREAIQRSSEGGGD